MIAKWIRPILRLRGSLTQDYYVRQLWGKQVIQRKPRQTSEKQRAMREAFGKMYAGKKKV